MNQETDVCIVGGGPAGATLGYLFASCGIRCELLERHSDFDRDFRGDTIHAGVMEIFDQLGLAEKILGLPHYKIATMETGGTPLVDFTRLPGKYRFITMIAQSIFLDFLTGEAKKLPEFSLQMGAKASDLIRDEETGSIRGVRFTRGGVEFSIRAKLVVACDGRASQMRKSAGLETRPVTDPIDVLWFRLNKDSKTPENEVFDGRRSGILTGGRTPFIVLERPDQLQIAAVVAHGGFRNIRNEGLPAFCERIREAAPDLADFADAELEDWNQIAFLSVTGSRLDQWWLPGLMIIGDAAHTMTPIGGVGINYAIWDAVETANLTIPLLREGKEIGIDCLREIQSRREPSTKRIQSIQRLVGRRILGRAAQSDPVRFELPRLMRRMIKLPLIRDLPPRLIAYGGWTPVKLKAFFTGKT